MYSAYKLNKQCDNIQPWHIPFPVRNQSVPRPVLTVASWPAYRFLRRQVRWSGAPIYWRIFQFVVIYIVKGFGIIKSKSRCFSGIFLVFLWSTDAVNLISASSAFSKSSLDIWKFTYCHSLTCRILSIILLVSEVSATIILAFLYNINYTLMHASILNYFSYSEKGLLWTFIWLCHLTFWISLFKF